MHKIRPVIPLRFARLCLAVGTLSGIAALGLSGQAAWADTTCTPPANGPTSPGASTFTYQCDGTYSGDWTNSYYAYNPNTGSQTALYSPDYSYDCTTGAWTQAKWDYDTASSTYVKNRVPATITPDQATNCAATTGSNTTNSAATSGGASTTAPSSPTPAINTPSSTATTTPPNPTATCPAVAGANSDSPSSNNGVSGSATVSNNVCSTAQSGNAGVTNNGTAGDATSGSATTKVTAANLVNSLSSTSSAGVLTFNRDVTGDQNGDIILDPTAIGAVAAGADPGNTVGTVNTDAAINNAITATSVSGDATVSGNGDGGDATSGNAETIVNLINMINSAVAAGQSFIGTINIYGDLNGNILIPQSVIDQLLASNAYADPSSSSESLNNNESITNNVNATAASGDATVADNNIGGNATSGNAKTNVTILNLTGSSIVGKNVLLVFVNVLGQWVGMIMNAPTGATSAEFGGNVTSNIPSTGSNVVEADANLSITNNVNATAASGDATVADNNIGGNATSGNASTAVNILNVEDSTLSLANWFGILFINVFGTWNGNFGIQPTAAAPVVSSTSSSDDPSSTQTTGFGTSDTGFSRHHFATFAAASVPVAEDGGDTTAVLGDAVAAPLSHAIDTTTQPASNDSHSNYVLPALGLILALLLLAGAERDRFIRKDS